MELPQLVQQRRERVVGLSSLLDCDFVFNDGEENGESRLACGDLDRRVSGKGICLRTGSIVNSLHLGNNRLRVLELIQLQKTVGNNGLLSTARNTDTLW